VRVVGRQQRQAVLGCQLQQPRVHLTLFGQPVVLQLDVEVLPAEDVQILFGEATGAVEVALE
jgi:hypothetical protein